jgi:hypothetical protein
VSSVERHRLRAWIARKRSELATERQELEQLLAADPADLASVDRLAEILEKDGNRDEADALRRRKGEIDQLVTCYLKLYERRQPIRDAVEMARIAERLGRNFEARGFFTIAIAYDSEREDLRRDLERLSRRPPAGIQRQTIVVHKRASQ